ncbi:MAG: FAD:protein FMN transferase [bacterium]
MSRSWPTMGTFAEVIIDTTREDKADRAIEDVRDVFDRVNRTMTVYKPHSDMNRFNRWAGHRSVSVDPWLIDLVDLSCRAERATRGAFSLNVLAYGQRDGLKPEFPGTRVPVKPGLSTCQIHTNSILSRLSSPSVSHGLDAGGIAKGYALDRAREQLIAHGFRKFFIRLGRSFYAGNSPGNSKGWPVKIVGTDDPVFLKQSVLSVSQQGVQTDTGHVVDPRTGQVVERSMAVAVFAREGWVSDAVSTALLVDPGLRSRVRSRFPEIQSIRFIR